MKSTFSGIQNNNTLKLCAYIVNRYCTFSGIQNNNTLKL